MTTILTAVLVSAMAQQQPALANCFTTVLTTTVSGATFPRQRMSQQLIRDGDQLRSDGLVQVDPANSELQTSIISPTQSTVVTNLLNGTVTCDTHSSSMNVTKFFEFPNLQLVGKKDYAGTTCNVWACTQNCTAGASRFELWTETTSDSVPVFIRIVFPNNGPTQEMVFSAFQLCKTIDPALFDSPANLKCSQTTSVNQKLKKSIF